MLRFKETMMRGINGDRSCQGGCCRCWHLQLLNWTELESRPAYRWHDIINKENIQDGYREPSIQESGAKRWGDV